MELQKRANHLMFTFILTQTIDSIEYYVKEQRDLTVLVHLVMMERNSPQLDLTLIIKSAFGIGNKRTFF